MNQNNISLETVLHALYGCSNVQSEFTDAVYVCTTCAYGKDDGRPCESLHPLLDDAYALLKEQEPVRPLIANDMYFCGNCKYAIPRTANYCPKCGKKVEWND